MRRLKAKQRILSEHHSSIESRTPQDGDGDIQRVSKNSRHQMNSLDDSNGDTASKNGTEGGGGGSERQLRMNPSKASSLIESFKARLTGSRFRTLNEDLYTTTSQQSLERFTKEPHLFEEYHDGFRHQVSSWPVNPVVVIVNKILKQQQARPKTEGKLVVADFGCGDAQLAHELLQLPKTDLGEISTEPSARKKRKRRKGGNEEQSMKTSSEVAVESDCFRVHSFDLVQPRNESRRHLVTACDMANVPLKSSSVDVGVFCLSLMGTNLADFIREAHRVLKPNACLWIAEVLSRFSNDGSCSTQSKPQPASSAKQPRAHRSKKGIHTEKNGLNAFKTVLDDLGFRCVDTDSSNKMFFLLRLVKSGKKPDASVAYTAKPCIYKRR